MRIVFVGAVTKPDFGLNIGTFTRSFLRWIGFSTNFTRNHFPATREFIQNDTSILGTNFVQKM